MALFCDASPPVVQVPQKYKFMVLTHNPLENFVVFPFFYITPQKQSVKKNCSASSCKIQNSLSVTFHRENQTVAYFLCSIVDGEGKKIIKCPY